MDEPCTFVPLLQITKYFKKRCRIYIFNLINFLKVTGTFVSYNLCTTFHCHHTSATDMFTHVFMFMKIILVAAPKLLYPALRSVIRLQVYLWVCVGCRVHRVIEVSGSAAGCFSHCNSRISSSNPSGGLHQLRAI